MNIENNKIQLQEMQHRYRRLKIIIQAATLTESYCKNERIDISLNNLIPTLKKEFLVLEQDIPALFVKIRASENKSKNKAEKNTKTKKYLSQLELKINNKKTKEKIMIYCESDSFIIVAGDSKVKYIKTKEGNIHTSGKTMTVTEILEERVIKEKNNLTIADIREAIEDDEKLPLFIEPLELAENFTLLI